MSSSACVNGDDACAPIDATGQSWGTVNGSPLLVKGDRQQATTHQPERPAIATATGWMSVLTSAGVLTQVASDGDATTANNRVNAGNQSWMSLPSTPARIFDPCPTTPPKACEREVLAFQISNRNYQPELDFSQFFVPGYMGLNYGDMVWMLRDLNGTIYFQNIPVSTSGTLQNVPSNSYWDAARHVFKSPYPYEGYMALMIGCKDENGVPHYLSPGEAYAKIHDIYLASGGRTEESPTTWSIMDDMIRITEGGSVEEITAYDAVVMDSIIRPEEGTNELSTTATLTAPIIGLRLGECDNYDAYGAVITDIAIRIDSGECEATLSATVFQAILTPTDGTCANSMGASINDATLKLISGDNSFTLGATISDMSVRFNSGGSNSLSTTASINDARIQFSSGADNDHTLNATLTDATVRFTSGGSNSHSLTATVNDATIKPSSGDVANSLDVSYRLSLIQFSNGGSNGESITATYSLRILTPNSGSAANSITATIA